MNAKILERLARGETIVGHRESGNSMTPLIHHREPVTLAPVDAARLERGDIVLAKVHGRYYLHLVRAFDADRVQIGNNHGRINGWTARSKVYAIVIAVGERTLPAAIQKVRR